LKEASNELVRHITKLILCTKSHEPGDIENAALLVDIDLSILGKPPERFSQFESGIRSEYAWVPADVYRQRRVEILERFLKRERIYFTQSFRERYEDAARRNLATLIAELRR
jgi:predicted metal-dependent HD superfamily phosphohydrolase